MIERALSSIKSSYKKKQIYATMERIPFYDIAQNYLPLTKDSLLLDIGAGSGNFGEHLNLSEKYTNFHLLDGNPETVKKLNEKFGNAIHYICPATLPFKNDSVDFIHSSHLIEHLQPQQLYSFLTEIDRVLKKKWSFNNQFSTTLGAFLQ